jgi:DHA1 family multidrug resistance protein-like MFS transporter
MKKHLFVLLACLFVVMIGFGIILPVLPFYAERLALARGASRQAVVMHVGLLTAVYALMQLAFAPLWGRLSARSRCMRRRAGTTVPRKSGPCSSCAGW